MGVSNRFTGGKRLPEYDVATAWGIGVSMHKLVHKVVGDDERRRLRHEPETFLVLAFNAEDAQSTSALRRRAIDHPTHLPSD